METRSIWKSKTHKHVFLNTEINGFTSFRCRFLKKLINSSILRQNKCKNCTLNESDWIKWRLANVKSTTNTGESGVCKMVLVFEGSPHRILKTRTLWGNKKERNMESKNERKQAENQKDVEKEWNAEKDGEQPGESENLRRQREVKQAENVKRGMKWKWRTWHSSADSRAESFLL